MSNMTNQPPRRPGRRLSFVFLCLGGLFILPLGILAIVSHFVDYEIPKSIDQIVGPALLVSLFLGVGCLAIAARLMKMGK
jgi:hypothetical protein